MEAALYQTKQQHVQSVVVLVTCGVNLISTLKNLLDALPPASSQDAMTAILDNFHTLPSHTPMADDAELNNQIAAGKHYADAFAAIKHFESTHNLNVQAMGNTYLQVCM